MTTRAHWNSEEFQITCSKIVESGGEYQGDPLEIQTALADNEYRRTVSAIQTMLCRLNEASHMQCYKGDTNKSRKAIVKRINFFRENVLRVNGLTVYGLSPLTYDDIRITEGRRWGGTGKKDNPIDELIHPVGLLFGVEKKTLPRISERVLRGTIVFVIKEHVKTLDPAQVLNLIHTRYGKRIKRSALNRYLNGGKGYDGIDGWFNNFLIAEFGR